MTRTLDFTGDRGPKRFELLRLALLNAGDGKGDRSRATIRKEARLLDALDVVSVAKPTQTDADFRVLLPEAGHCRVFQEDFDLLTTYVDQTQWVPRAAREVVDLQDWLSAAEKVE